MEIWVWRYGGLAIPGWGLCTFDTGWCSAVYRVSCIVHRALCIVYHVSCIVYGALHRGLVIPGWVGDPVREQHQYQTSSSFPLPDIYEIYLMHWRY